jgi:hypothetical protein
MGEPNTNGAQKLFPIIDLFEAEMQRQHTALKSALEPAALLARVIPIAIDDPERDVLVRRAGTDEANDARVFFARGRERLAFAPAVFADDLVGGCFCRVEEIRVEDVEFVALDYFWGRRVVRVVRLVVFVPVVA